MFRWPIYRIMEMLSRQFNCGNETKLAKRIGDRKANMEIEETLYLERLTYIYKMWSAD